LPAVVTVAAAVAAFLAALDPNLTLPVELE
jgi:hypothetical protein